MQCRDVRDLADSFLSEQLLVETNHELLRHLEGCPDCRAEVEARRTLRASIQRAVLNADTLRMREEFARDLVPRLRASGGGAGWSVRGWRGAAAAAVVMLAALVWLFLLSSGASALARDAIGDHRDCAVHFRLAEQPIPLDEAASRFGAWYGALQETPPAEVTADAGTLRVVGRHVCVFNGRRFAHIVLDLEGQVVSLLVTDDRSWSTMRVGGDERPRLASQSAVGVGVVTFRTAYFLRGQSQRAGAARDRGNAGRATGAASRQRLD